MNKPDYKTIEHIIEVMQTIKAGDDIIFDNMFGAFKITKLLEAKNETTKTKNISR